MAEHAVTSRVVEYVDIRAPKDEVFKLILNLTRRMQLSPLWGLAKIDFISADYPQPGSHYDVTLVQGDGSHYSTEITENLADRKFSYTLDVARETRVAWLIQDTAEGTRLIYQEEFLVTEGEEDEFSQAVRKVVRDWLKNIKNYTELRNSAVGRFIRWGLDRFFLQLRKDQRQVVATLLFLQISGFISFVMAALALGVAGLF
jgi:hypothetical protein